MKSSTEKILVIGAGGQLGTELTLALRDVYGADQVIASDIHTHNKLLGESGRFEQLDVLNAQRLGELIDRYQITQVYHLAAVLSAVGEQNPVFAWRLNMEGLLNVLEVAREKKLHKVYWPSSIAVFGAHTPAENTPQYTVMDPSTVYGISKQAGERWCEYYFAKYQVDVRSLRYPGLISYKTPPGGGTTDYAIDIFHKALAGVPFDCFLAEDTYLPMMYMPDALHATLQLMEAEASQIRVRSSYNVGALSFSPREISAEIRRHIPDFSIRYNPDFRQQIARSWPDSIDDTFAREDWNWAPRYELPAMTNDMITQLKKRKKQELV